MGLGRLLGTVQTIEESVFWQLTMAIHVEMVTCLESFESYLLALKQLKRVTYSSKATSKI